MQTTTNVHSTLSKESFLQRAQLKENSLSLSVILYAQLISMSALSLLPMVSTASYLSVLLSLLPAGAVYALSTFAVKKGKQLGRASAIVFSLLFFSDMALCLFSLTELTCAYVLPHYPRTAVALPAALFTGAALSGKEIGGARRTAVFLIGFFLAALVICLCFAAPESDIGYVFPLLGYGGKQILRGGVYMTGGLWSAAALPYFTHAPKIKTRAALFPLFAVLLMAGVLFMCACLLPAPLLPGNWGFVLRLQLLMEMSPNTLTWSLMLISRMLLFLCAFATAGDFCCECLQTARKGKRASMLPLALASSLLPLLPFDRVTPLLSLLLPLRGVIALMGAVFPFFGRKAA